MPGVMYAGPDIVTECCSAPVQVTRVVHDVCEYDPVELAPAADGRPVTLHVKYNGRNNPLDSDGYEAHCEGCLRPLDIEIEED
jgi:hypothetical protein